MMPGWPLPALLVGPALMVVLLRLPAVLVRLSPLLLLPLLVLPPFPAAAAAAVDE
jgi:hypothetical protein